MRLINPLRLFLVLTYLSFAQAWALDTGSIHFVLDGKATPIPEDLKKVLSRSKDSEIAPEVAIVQAFSLNQKFKDIKLFKGGPKEKQWILEASTITKVFEVSISGLGFLEEGAYKSSLLLKPGKPFHESHLQLDKSQLISTLRRRGYPAAQIVDEDLDDDGKGNLSIKLKVKKGRPCRIAEVRISPPRFLNLLSNPIEPGSICDQSQIEDALERARATLLNKNYFNAEVRLEGLTYTADRERAIVRIYLNPGVRTSLEVINGSTREVLDNEDTLKTTLSSYDMSFFSEEDVAQHVLNHYLNQGYARAKLTGPKKVSDDPSAVTLRFEAQLGNSYHINEVQFENELPFKKSMALEAMDLDTSWFRGPKPWIQSKLKDYQSALSSLLSTEGYLNAKVAAPRVSFKPSSQGVILTFSFEKGPKYVLKDFSLVGIPKEFQMNYQELKEILSPGNAISQKKIMDFREALRLQLLNTGYFFSDVDIKTETLEEVGGIIPTKIVATITSDKLTHIRDISAQGSLFEKEDRIIQETNLNRGDIFTPFKIDRGRLRLLQHDLFSTVSIEPTQLVSSDPTLDYVDLIIKTQGRTGYTLGLSPSYGSYRGYTFAADYVKNALTTHGLKFTANASVSQNKQQKQSKAAKRLLGYKLSAGVSEPLLRLGQWQSPFDGLISGSLELADNEISSHRIVRTLSLGIVWKPPFFDWLWNISTRLSSESSTILADVIEPIEALDRPNILINEIITGVGLDTRNDKDWPTLGGQFDVSTQHPRFGFYSDVQYNRFSTENEVFYPIGFGFSGAFLFGGSKITAIRNKEQETITAPGNRRKRLMGPSQVRGFPDEGLPLGPLLWLDLTPGNALTPAHNCTRSVAGIGATNVMYLKHELRYRYPKNFGGVGLGIVGFVDSGTAFFTDGEQNRIRESLLSLSSGAGATPKYNQCLITGAYLIDNDDVKLKPNLVLADYAKAAYVSAGIGIRIITPNVFSVALDWGIPVRDPGDKTPGCIPSNEKNTWSGPGEPTCVLRRSRDKFFARELPFPGAIHFRIDASL